MNIRKSTARRPPIKPRRIKRVTIEPDSFAKMLGVSRATIYAGLRSGTIPSKRIGKRFIIPASAIHEWLKSGAPASFQPARA